MRLSQLEEELKKRFVHPYQWGRTQNNSWDQATNFIYQIPHLEQVLTECNNRFANHENAQEWQNYALNRWYNFWSAWAIEKVFGASLEVIPAKNPKDSEKDFFIKGLPFDHKTTVFPKNYPHSLVYAQQNPESLIRWLYKHQSKENRQHFKNRLFIVLYDSYFERHWQLKAYLIWLKALVDYYVNHFDAEKLVTVPLEDHSPVLADIIWAIR
ncbi:hypothetical protein BKI52_05535 [marine bacterium AO1-C]|nr:hypothetical protein BKI52_05535 [marine bacterium AO1-C]